MVRRERRRERLEAVPLRLEVVLPRFAAWRSVERMALAAVA
jgi:hypothetical protein